MHDHKYTCLLIGFACFSLNAGDSQDKKESREDHDAYLKRMIAKEIEQGGPYIHFTDAELIQVGKILNAYRAQQENAKRHSHDPSLVGSFSPRAYNQERFEKDPVKR